MVACRPLRLALSRHQAHRLKKGEGVRVSHSDIAPKEGGVVVWMSAPQHGKLTRSKYKKRGRIVKLNKVELKTNAVGGGKFGAMVRQTWPSGLLTVKGLHGKGKGDF